MAESYGQKLLVILTILCVASRADRRHQTNSCIETWDGVPEGEFSSPNFPSKYSANDLCVWNIQGSNASSRIVLTFEAFMLEDSPECKNDFVEIGEPLSSRMQHGKRMCGMQSKFQVVSKTNHLTILFQSDGQNQFPGFRAAFKVVPASSIDNSTSVSVDAYSGSKSSSKPTKPSSGQSDMCRCGEEPSKTRRIVGGQVVQENKFPWLVVLVTPEAQTSAHCGGVLLTPQHVVTAAHCTRGKTNESYRVVAGAYNLFTRESETYAVRNVERLIPHENYNRTTEENDIALIKLTKPFDLSSAIQPICLPSGDVGDLLGQTTVTAGWGKIKYMGDSSAVPRSVELPVVSNQACIDAFKNTDARISDKMLCAGVLDGSVDACQGDSGGPLMWYDKKDRRWHLVGVVSFGVRCATPGYYGVYTRVSKYIDWLESQLQEPSCNSTTG